MVNNAGAMVSAAATATSMPIANGMPSVWKYGSLVKCRQNVAPANAAPCQGEACRSPLSPAPPAALPATAGLVGPASAKPRHQAKKKKKQKKQQQSRKRHKRKHRGDLRRPADAIKKGGQR